ncbi:MAG: efflux RND transporter periplasmic adaptor subunit [Holosporaceae bacterium]|nr:efflux RND transporter periplasmic adaptor subunit [Holosporaceae bacterium]
MFGKKKLICLLVFALIILFFISYRLANRSPVKIENPLPPVSVARSTMGPVIRYVNAIGTLRPYDSVVIKSEVSSMITNINFSEGMIVKEGDLLLELDDSVARAALMEAEAQFRKAKSEFEPVEKLADKGVTARISRDTKKAEMDMCEARVLSSKNTLKKHKIYAPFSGIAGLREISRGQYVAPGNELLKLVDCHLLKVDFKVSEIDIGNIYVGQEARILVGGDRSQEYPAKIIAIDPECDRVSHTFDVRAILEVPEDVAVESTVLKPGRFVSVKVAPEGNAVGVVIPESAIEKLGDDDYVFRVVEGIAVRTPVTIGMKKDGMVEIITGINCDETVIVSGQSGVLEGRSVLVQDALSNALVEELGQHSAER